MNLVQKIRALTDSIAKNAKPLQTQEDWELVARLLTRTPADQDAARAATKAKDVAALDAVVRALENPGAPQHTPTPADAGQASGASEAFSQEDKAAALRAFKKRLRVLRLSDESKLGGRYTSGGRRSGIDAIEPPETFPREIWAALVSDGRLVDTGQGFYALPES